MTSFDQILNRWLGGYPKGQVPIESSARIDALTNLFKEFRKEGYKKEYFTNTIKAKIVTNCINPNHRDKRKKKVWAEYVSKHLEIAFYAIYDEKVEMAENDLIAKPISEEDMDVSGEPELPIESLQESGQHENAPFTEDTPCFTGNPDDFVSKVNNSKNSNFDPEMAELLGLKIK